MDIEQIRVYIIDSVKKVESSEWEEVKIHFDFPPFTNAGNKGSHLFLRKDGTIIPIFAKFEHRFSWNIILFFYENCDKNNCNKITFKGRRDNLQEATIEFEFDQQILDEFLNNLPKSKRGKTIPWYKNDDEVKKLKDLVNMP